MQTKALHSYGTGKTRGKREFSMHESCTQDPCSHAREHLLMRGTGTPRCYQNASGRGKSSSALIDTVIQRTGTTVIKPAQEFYC